MQTAITYSSLAASLMLLSACNGTLVDAPSLNKRAFEISLEEMRAQASLGSNVGDSILASNGLDRDSIGVGLGDDVKKIWQTHNKADNDFAVQSSKAQMIVRKARGRAFGSDDWSIAQVQISRLDRVRAPSLKSLGMLDKIIFARLEDKTSSENIDRLLQVQKFVQSDVATQSRFLDNLSNTLAKR